MIDGIINKILDALEYKKMYDAAIEVCRIVGLDENMIDYYKVLKGENISVDINKLDEQYKEKLEYIAKLRREESQIKELVAIEDDGRVKAIIEKAFNYFNSGEYKTAEKYFKDATGYFKDDRRVSALTYTCLCQYRTEEYVAALRSINEAIDFHSWNNDIKKIRDGIIDRLSGIESKNRFIEEYYSKGTIIGEILRHSLELYQKIDNIEVENKNLFKKVSSFIGEAKRLFINERYNLEKDLVNVDSFIANAERQLNFYLEDEEVKKFAMNIEKYCLPPEVEKVFKAGEMLYARNSKDRDIDFSHIIFLYSKGVEMLCREKISPYFKKNRVNMPVIEGREDYKKIGINVFDVGGLTRYSFKGGFNIALSEYLSEITKHILLRKEFRGREHVMPWDKLKFISHCIKTGKDPVDGTKSAGMLLLFYGYYYNFLGLDYTIQLQDILVLSGNLIRLQNERNSLIHSKVLDDKEWMDTIRNLSFDCVEKLCLIK